MAISASGADTRATRLPRCLPRPNWRDAAAAIYQGRVGTLSNWKTFASAEASRKAIFSAQLAQAGMTGPNQVFEGRDGFFNVISRKPFKLPKLGGGGEPYGI